MSFNNIVAKSRRPDRRCQACGAQCPPRYGIPDPCLGFLPGVFNACCGHGSKASCYVQVPATRETIPSASKRPDGEPRISVSPLHPERGEVVCIRGNIAWHIQRELGGDPAPLTNNQPLTGGALRGWPIKKEPSV